MQDRRTTGERRTALSDVEAVGRKERRREAGRRSEERWREFGRWLKDQRTRLPGGITQLEAAKAADLTVRQWSRLETGLSGTSYRTIPKIAGAIGANEAETYRRAGFLPPDVEPRIQPVNSRGELGLASAGVVVKAGEEDDTTRELEARVEKLERRVDQLVASMIMLSKCLDVDTGKSSES